MRIKILALALCAAAAAGAQVFPLGNRSGVATCGILSAATGSIAGSEVQVVQCQLGPNQLQVGSSYLLVAYGQANNSITTAQTYTFRMRVGTTSLSGAIAASVAPANNQTTNCALASIEVFGVITVRSIGSSGTITGNIGAHSANGTGATAAFNGGLANSVSATTSTVSIDTTAQNIVEFTAATSSASVVLTFQEAAIFPLQ
ncbi:MAG: hypothetical protein U0Q18_25265 [Bryobacteraceae bacterium]